MKRKNERSKTVPPKKRKLAQHKILMQEKHGFQYISSTYDNKYQHYFEIKNVNILGEKGYGLFATKNIPANAIIGEYTGKILKELPEDDSYCMDCDKKNGYLYIDARESGNDTRFGNHSDHQFSAQFVYKEKEKIIVVETVKDIPQGAQVLINYNKPQDINFLFLNSSDNELSSSDILKKNLENYIEYTTTTLLHSMGLQEYPNSGQVIYLPKPFAYLVNEHITSNFDQLFYSCKNLPILLKQKDDVAAFNEFDSFTPLMLACFLGHEQTVKKLLKDSVDPNIQQHHSGKTALFYAASGYAKSIDHSKEHFLKIVQLLISNGANVVIQNRQENTFIHDVLLEWDAEHFSEVIKLCKTYKQGFKDTDIKSFRNLTELVNVLGDDLIITAIKHLKIPQLKLILKQFPKYCAKTFVNDQQDEFCYSSERLLSLITLYTEEDINELKVILKEYGTTNKYLRKLDELILEKGTNPTLFGEMPEPFMALAVNAVPLTEDIELKNPVESSANFNDSDQNIEIIDLLEEAKYCANSVNSKNKVADKPSNVIDLTEESPQSFYSYHQTPITPLPTNYFPHGQIMQNNPYSIPYTVFALHNQFPNMPAMPNKPFIPNENALVSNSTNHRRPENMSSGFGFRGYNPSFFQSTPPPTVPVVFQPSPFQSNGNCS